MTENDLRRYFSESLESGKISHAYIIEGAQRPEEAEPVMEYVERLQGRMGHPDTVTVTHDRPAVIAVGEIRSQVVDDVVIRPYMGPYKVYLIPDADLMSTAAQNALLKTLEEPPEYVVIFLFTAGSRDLLPTIYSRAVTLQLQQSGPQKDPELEERMWEIISQLPSGSVAEKAEAARQIIAECRERSVPAADALAVMRTVVKDMLVITSGGPAEILSMPHRAGELARMASGYTKERLLGIYDEVNNTGEELKINVNTELALEKLLLAF